MRKFVIFAVVATAVTMFFGNVEQDKLNTPSEISISDNDTEVIMMNPSGVVEDEVVFVRPTNKPSVVVDDEVIFVKPGNNESVSDNDAEEEKSEEIENKDNSTKVEDPEVDSKEEKKEEDNAKVEPSKVEPAKSEPTKAPEVKQAQTQPQVQPQPQVQTPSVSTEANAEESNDKGVAEFVERLYSVALGRGSDPAGKESWIAAAKNGGTGADLARGFLYSPEFLNKNVSNEEFVRTLYKTFFNRDPDPAGFNGWVNALNTGSSRQHIVDGFIGSTEYADLCLTYRVNAGTGVKPSIHVEPTKEINDFTERLYSLCLGRHSDPDGLKGWSNAMANMEASGASVAHGFFWSPEFLNANYSNAEYVRKLYNVCLNREPDSDGFNGWVNALNNGASREEVFNGFAHSTEFKQLCAAAGIVPGNERYAGTTRVVTNNASKTWIKETVDTGRRRTSPIYEYFQREWCVTCGKEFDLYDPNDSCPKLTHMFETQVIGPNGAIISAHTGSAGCIGKIQVGTFQERIMETHERCLETGEVRNRTTFWEEGGERYYWRANVWND